MRLKEDSSSWKSSGIKHRDNRHDPTERPVKLTGKKDKRKWCKGKVGIPHQYEKVRKQRFVIGEWSFYMEVDKCTGCGREHYVSFGKEKRA